MATATGHFEGGSPGLSQVARMFLQCRVDKTEQISDWDRRPLSHNQLVYAALDAEAMLVLAVSLLSRPRIL